MCSMFLASSLLMGGMMMGTKRVVIYDEGERHVVYTLSGDPQRAVAAAGIELGADDEITCSGDLSQGFGVVQVERAFPVLITAARNSASSQRYTTPRTICPPRCRAFWPMPASLWGSRIWYILHRKKN